MKKTKKRVIGLALSGGGAVGAGHLGVLEELEQAGIRAEIISGVSAGAVVGLLYAAGGVDLVRRFYDEMTSYKRRLLFRPTPDHFFHLIEQALERLINVRDFKSLPRQFACTATDLLTGQQVILRRGNPIKAVMASAAYPGLFPPQHLDGKWLVDGGVTNNMPADILDDFGATFVIGVSLYHLTQLSATSALHLNRVSQLIRAIDTLQARANEQQMKACDFVFLPEVGGFLPYEFGRMEEMWEVSRHYANQKMPQLKEQLQ